MRKRIIAALVAMAGSACGTPDGETNTVKSFSRIAAEDTISFIGTEPFWGGQISGTTATYSTPENADGVSIPVTRFAGRGGISWAGTHEGDRFALAVTPGDCSDGMSDRRFPFVATLEVGGEQRSGCAWTDEQPYSDESPAVE